MIWGGGGGGGGGGVRQEIKIPRKLLIKIYIPTDFGQKKYAQRGSVQVRLLQINYEVNDKSRLKIERDFFFLNLNMTHE